MGNGIIRPSSPSLNGVSACVSLCTHACMGIKLELIFFCFSEQEVRIHGLGAAINRAINLALQLEQRGQGTVEVYNIKNLNLTTPTMGPFRANGNKQRSKYLQLAGGRPVGYLQADPGVELRTPKNNTRGKFMS